MLTLTCLNESDLMTSIFIENTAILVLLYVVLGYLQQMETTVAAVTEWTLPSSDS